MIPTSFFVVVLACGIPSDARLFDASVLPKQLGACFFAGIAAVVLSLCQLVNKANRTISIYDVVVLVLTVSLCIMYAFRGDFSCIFNTALFSSVYLMCRQAKSNKQIKGAFVSGLLVCLLYSVAVCVRQVCRGLSVDGGYDSVSGLSLIIALAAICVMTMRKSRAVLAAVVLALTLCALVLIGARTAIVAVLCSSMFIATKKMRVFIILVGVIVTVILSVHKSESTSGRFFISKTSVSLFDTPANIMFGRGSNGFRASYMRLQAKRLKYGTRDERKRADNIKHPLNDCVLFIVNYGLLPLVLCIISLCAVLKKGRQDFHAHSIMLCLLVFAMFTYPFHYPITYVALAFSIARIVRSLPYKKNINILVDALFFYVLPLMMGTLLALCSLCVYSWNTQWKRTYSNFMFGMREDALQGYARLAKSPFVSCEFYYNWAYVLLKTNNVADAKIAIGSCGIVDYDTQMLRGDICASEGNVKQTVQLYSEASDMCPNRFMPLYAQYILYERHGKLVEMMSVGREILQKEEKIKSPVITNIKKSVSESMRLNIPNLK